LPTLLARAKLTEKYLPDYGARLTGRAGVIKQIISGYFFGDLP